MKTDRLIGLWGWAAVGALLAVGCSKQAKLERHLKRGEAYFNKRQYARAEVELLNVLRLQQLQPFAVRTLGLIYYEQGRWDKAMAFLQVARDQATNDLAIRVRLGDCLLAGSRFNEAFQEALFVLSHQPTNDEALVLLADAAVGTNEAAQARHRLEKLRPVAQNQPGLHVALGLLALRQQDYQQAEAAFQQALKLDPNSTAAQVSLGHLYLLQNDLQKAEALYKTAAALAPPSPRSLNYALFLRRTGNLQGARQWLEELTKRAPDFFPANLQLAELALQEKKHDECAALLKRVLAMDPNNYQALLLDAKLQLAQGNGTNALTRLERLNTAYPQTPEILHQMALAHLLNNDVARAIGSLNQAVQVAPLYADAVLLLAELNIRRGDPDAAVLPLSTLIAKDPNNTQAQLLLAAAHRARKDPETAAAIYKKLIAADPKSAELRFFLGLTYLQQNRRAEARQAFEQARQLAPEMLGPLEQLVDLDLADKQFAAALGRINPLLETNPKAPLLHALLAKVYWAQGNLKQAEAALLKAVELDPDYTVGQTMLSQLYLASRQPEKALQALEKTLALDPQAVGARLQVAIIHHSLSNYPAARDAYEKVLALRPNSSLALNNLAYLYCEQFNQLDRAHELARRARELAPTAPDVADTLGWILCKQGDYSRALPLLQESAAKLPDEPEVAYHLGVAHYMLGQEQPAQAALQRALQAKQDFPGKVDAQRRLVILAIDPTQPTPALVAQLESRAGQDPADPMLLAKLATAYEKTGATAKALSSWQQVLKLSPKHLPAMLALSRLHAQQADLKKAIEWARAARDLAPADPQIAHILGRLAYQTGDHKWALSLLQETAGKLPQQPEVLYDLAWAQCAAGRLPQAQASMQAALQTGKPFPQTQTATQFIHFIALAADLDRARQAAPQIDQALKADPNHLPALLLSGLLQERAGNTNAAAQLYESILTRFPLFTPANLRLAILYAGPLANDQKATQHGLKAREAFPTDPELARALGMVAYRQAQYARAAQLLRESAAQRTNDAELFFHLGMAHFHLKQTAQSKEALGQALALAPNASFATQAKQTLAKLQ